MTKFWLYSKTVWGLITSGGGLAGLIVTLLGLVGVQPEPGEVELITSNKDQIVLSFSAIAAVFGQILQSIINKGIHANPLLLLALPYFGLRLEGVGCL